MPLNSHEKRDSTVANISVVFSLDPGLLE